MHDILEATQLTELGLTTQEANTICSQVQKLITSLPGAECWQQITQTVLKRQHPFALHKLLYTTVYPEWDKMPAPAWLPQPELSAQTNLTASMTELELPSYDAFYHWSVQHYPQFWEFAINKLNIQFQQPFSKMVDLTAGIESPKWLVNAKLNIVDSCLQAAANATAIIYQNENSVIQKISYVELTQLVNRIANSVKNHFKPGDAIGICMPMTAECVAIYLGIIKAGCVVVSIADSFSADEIATRLRIANAKGIFTQDYILRSGKQLPLYTRVQTANAPFAIVLPCKEKLTEKLRSTDQSWQTFLDTHDQFTTLTSNPQDTINILFSSGTTGDPKAIPWDHTTAIKAAVDAYFHHDIKAGDVIAWPTNIGWMMGPWLIFASLLNQGTIALFDGSPLEKGFGEFVQNARVTMLGLVPSIVKAWRTSACMEQLDWSAIKCFSSSGESSNVEDMLYLMWLANYRPIIEYCGGTEIGGAYVTGTFLQPSAPATFTTPTLGLDFIILDEQGKPTNNGEVALIPPSIGLSTRLINKDHHAVYYAEMPKSPDGKILRRHGDQIEKFANGYYRAHGRVDDTMNLGGVKVSSAEIERCLMGTEHILETAAIAVNPPGGGPSYLVIYAVPQNSVELDLATLKKHMQAVISQHLNPLFKIHDVMLIDALPRTASNKVMRRVLRDRYGAKS